MCAYVSIVSTSDVPLFLPFSQTFLCFDRLRVRDQFTSKAWIVSPSVGMSSRSEDDAFLILPKSVASLTTFVSHLFFKTFW